MKVQGSQKQVKPLEVNVDTVYIRSNVKRIETEDFVGWEYDEVTFPIREYLESLASNEDAGLLAEIITSLMLEIDTLKARLDNLEG